MGNIFLALKKCFIHCNIRSLSFKYHGLHMGVNLRRAATWKPMLYLIFNHLGSWSNSFFIMGGKVVHINSVINSITIFFFTLTKNVDRSMEPFC